MRRPIAPCQVAVQAFCRLHASWVRQAGGCFQEGWEANETRDGLGEISPLAGFLAQRRVSKSAKKSAGAAKTRTAPSGATPRAARGGESEAGQDGVALGGMPGPPPERSPENPAGCER